MSQLLRQGFIAALAPAGVPNCDIVMTDEVGDRLCAIQVKTRRALGSDGGWHMGRKHEELDSPSLFYCFVDFGGSPTADARTSVVPASVVADTLRRSHRAWLSQPGAKGQQRNDGSMRRFLPDYSRLGLLDRSAGWLECYFEDWDQLRGL